jgi:protein kinase A
MPTLGFLKKKRTKDDPADAQGPKSPNTPTKTGFFHRHRLSSNANHHKQQSPSQSDSQSPSQSQQQVNSSLSEKEQQSKLLPQSGHLDAGIPASVQSLSPGTVAPGVSPFVPASAQEQPATSGAQEDQQPEQSQNQSQQPDPMVLDGAVSSPESNNAATADKSNHVAIVGSPGADAAQASDKSNTANNLASPPPENDVAAAGNDHTNSHAPPTSGQQASLTPMVSPGTEPKQQTSTMQSQMQQQPPSTQQQQSDAVQKSGHQQQPSQGGSLPRVTKGKYSLADFDILRTLGTGSFGRVHLVQSKHNQRFYAVKVLKKAQVVKMKQVEHTNDERRMLSDVKHPFLITLWGTFVDTKNLYMVMDFVEGGELFSLLRKSGRFPNPVAKFYAAEVTLALEYLHSKNIIYRDLKPENLLLDRHGHLKITDFGFAKRVPDKTWTLCGTPDYLAPEVVSNKGYNKSVDWWSLGILIYEMLCGYTPFWDSGSPMKIYENILKGKIKYPAYINPDAQNLLERLITADLTKRLGNLYAGSQDVKSHPWFAEVTWDRLARKDIDAPYTPPVKAGAGDASQFDRYPEEVEQYGTTKGNDEYGYMFTEF